jgi:Cu+-exporting ATPase
MLLTGLNKRNASYIKKQTDIDDIRFEIFPEQKVRELQLMRTRKAVIAVLGDCELDIEALEAADVRITWLPPAQEKNKETALAEERAEEETPGPDPDFPDEPPQQDIRGNAAAAKTVKPHISIPKGDFLALARLRNRAATGMKLVGQQRNIAIVLCLALMVPATNTLTPFGLPFLEPIVALLGNLLIAVFILLISFRA